MAKAKKSKKKVKRDTDQEFIDWLESMTNKHKTKVEEPESGVYAWHISAFDKDGNEIRYSEDDEIPHYASMDKVTLQRHLDAILKLVVIDVDVAIKQARIVLK